MLNLNDTVTGDKVRGMRSDVTMPERKKRGQLCSQAWHRDNLQGGSGLDSTPGLVSQPRRRQELG